MVNLSKASVADLEAELERRKAAKPTMTPLPYDAERWKKFVASVDEIIQERIDKGQGNEDDDHWIYEAAIQYVYGDDAFDTLNKLG